jgi:hypothetical protein
VFKVLIKHSDNVSENKIGKDVTFLNSEVTTVKCSASQSLVKYSFLFKIIVYTFGTQNFMDMNIILAQR